MSASMDIQKFINSLEQQYKPQAQQAARRAVYRFANKVIQDAVKLCPIDTTPKAPHPGFLRNSATVGEPVGDGAETTVEIGFNAYYAAAVHEILTNHHPEGQAKYLETAMRANAPKLKDYVIQEMEKVKNRS